jgi:hypothetical protein
MVSVAKKAGIRDVISKGDNSERLLEAIAKLLDTEQSPPVFCQPKRNYRYHEERRAPGSGLTQVLCVADSPIRSNRQNGQNPRIEVPAGYTGKTREDGRSG